MTVQSVMSGASPERLYVRNKSSADPQSLVLRDTQVRQAGSKPPTTNKGGTNLNSNAKHGGNFSMIKKMIRMAHLGKGHNGTTLKQFHSGPVTSLLQTPRYKVTLERGINGTT